MLDVDWTLPVALVSVVVFLVLMHRILFRPLGQFIEAREQGIHSDLEEASRSRQQAATVLTGYESALGAARREITEQDATAQRAAEARQREIIEQARGEAARLVAEAQSTIAREAEQARARLTDDARGLAQLVVVKLMGRETAR